MPGHLPAIAVRGHLSPVLSAYFRVRQTFFVISYREHHLIRDHSFIHKVQYQKICHLPHDQLRLFAGIGTVQHLSCANAPILRLVRFNGAHSGVFKAPGVIDQMLGIYAKEMIQQILIFQGTSGHISHSKHSVCFQFSGVSGAYPPKVGERPMRPKETPVTFLVQLRYPHSVFVCRHVFCHDIHCHLAQIQIRANAAGGSDARFFQYVLDHSSAQLPGCQLVGFQISRHIHEYLVDGIDMDILLCYIFQINVINPGAVLHIELHPGHRGNVSQFQCRIVFQLLTVI